MKAILETWDINNRINIYLLNAIAEEHLADKSASRGRTVGEQFAHIHQVRLMWIKASAPALLDEQQKIEQESISRKLLQTRLSESASGISKLLALGLETGKIKGFKPHPQAFLGYLISHESHHRGQILLSLKQSGHPVDKKTQFGIWEWGQR